MAAPLRVLRCDVLGAEGVGKASLIHKFVHRRTSEPDSVGKMGKSPATASRPVDILGRPPIMAVFSSHRLGAPRTDTPDAAMLIYDVGDSNSFEAALNWLRNSAVSRPASVILVGNKTDRSSVSRVPSRQGMDAAVQHGLSFVETSATDGVNVDAAFCDVLFNAAHGTHLPAAVPEADTVAAPEAVARCLQTLGIQAHIAQQVVAQIRPTTPRDGMRAMELAMATQWSPSVEASSAAPSDTVITQALVELGVEIAVAQRAVHQAGAAPWQAMELALALSWLSC